MVSYSYWVAGYSRTTLIASRVHLSEGCKQWVSFALIAN